MYNKINLLITDDNPDDIYIIRELLKGITKTVIQYEHEKSLGSTLKRLEKEKFDCVLLDLNLLDSLGTDTLKDLLDQHPELPIVVLTVIDDEDTAIKSLHEGAQDYLVKGKIDGEIILRSVQYAIERKKVENGLRDSEKKYRNIVNTILEGLWITDAEGKTTYINKQLAKMLGYTEEEILNKPFFDFVDKSLQLDAKQFFERRKKGIKDRYDFRFIKKDGSTLWVIVSASPIFDKKGKFAGAMGLLTDIADHKLMEQSLEKSVQEWNSTFNAIADIICIIDLDGRITHCNDAADILFKKSNEEIIGKTCWEILNCPPDRLKNCPIINMQKTHKREVLILQIDGKWYHSAVDPIIDSKGNIVGGVHIISDITKYKLSQESLKESELALKKSQQVAHVGHWICLPKTNKVIWSDEMFNIFGITKDQFNELESDLDKIINKTIHPDDREKFRRLSDNTRLQEDATPLEYRIIWPNGTIRIIWGELGEKITNGSGEVVRLFGIIQDITDRKKVEDRLKESEELYRTITEYSNDMIWSLDRDGNFTFFNKRSEQISGYILEELKGKSFHHIIIEKDLNRVIDIFHSTLNGNSQQYEVTFKSKYNKLVTLSVNTTPIYSKGQIIGTLSSGRDITEIVKASKKLKILNERLVTSNKELQDFAYIASHDLQEPLRTVYGFVELLAENYKGKLGPEADEYIEFITAGTKRMQNMIDDLLAVSRIGTRGKKFVSTDIERVLNIVFKSLHSLIDKNQAVITHDPMPTIIADDAQITQLFQNLVENAIKFRREETPKIHISCKRKNGELIFSVKDNGIGIDKKQFKKLFIIFQRLHSREEYPGTGIGLAMCKKIVERHGGKIWVESDVGIGSIFYFTIPIVSTSDDNK